MSRKMGIVNIVLNAKVSKQQILICHHINNIMYLIEQTINMVMGYSGPMRVVEYPNWLT